MNLNSNPIYKQNTKKKSQISKKGNLFYFNNARNYPLTNWKL
jgi:hypothetical protein